jgi:hypothetical protein
LAQGVRDSYQSASRRASTVLQVLERTERDIGAFGEFLLGEATLDALGSKALAQFDLEFLVLSGHGTSLK